MCECSNEDMGDLAGGMSVAESEFYFYVEVTGILAIDAMDYMMSINDVLRKYYCGIVEIWLPRDNLFIVEYVTSNAKEVASFDYLKEAILNMSKRYCEMTYQ